MRVLVACEESQRVCIEFRKRGHEAFSCDIEPCSGGHFEWHIQGDVIPLLNGDCTFQTADTHTHTQRGPWDLIIGFPPCTYISNAGAARLFRNVHDGEFQMVNVERLKNGILGRDLFMRILLANCKHIAVENPVPSSIFCIPKASQAIQPYWFGHPYSKKTCLWLKNLPPLLPTEMVYEYKPYVSCGTSRNKGNPDKAGVSRAGGAQKVRSKTFTGVAAAMADQWGMCLERGM